jgi:methylglutaconyl-CoA hydratase
VVLLAGEGASFCAGSDVTEISTGGAIVEEHGAALTRLLRSVIECGAPVVSLVHGNAVGAGAALAACSDIVIAHEDALFSFPEVRVGFAPSIVLPFVIDALGRRQGGRLLLTGEQIDAQTAVRMGLAHELTGDLEAARERARSLFQGTASTAVADTKRMLRQAGG